MPIQTTFSDAKLYDLLATRRDEVVLDTGVKAGVVMEGAKGKKMVVPGKRQEYKEAKGAVSIPLSLATDLTSIPLVQQVLGRQ